MTYLLLKALHLAAVLAWVGGMLVVGVALGGLRPGVASPVTHVRLIPLTVQRWDRRITSPVMLLAWALGLTLIVRDGWMGAGWLSGKLVIALGLAALHGLLSGHLRRALKDSGTLRAAVPAWSAAAVMAAVAGIVLLVVLKPF